MKSIMNDVLYNILERINIKTNIKYISYGDGEQNYSIFYENKYPYNIVNKEWNMYYKKNIIDNI